MKTKFDFSRIMKSKITWAVIAELMILLVCLIIRPEFFQISYQESTGMLYGSLIDILNRSSEITIIALGMTLVIALAGTDLSVGALVALSGAMALKLMRWDMSEFPTAGDYSITPMFWVILVALGICALFGSFNGLMIARFGMQPIIATLVLMVAGRGVAQIITNGRQMTTNFAAFKFISQGSVLFLPMPIIITVVIFILMSLLTRKTAFGMFVESVGINPNASRVSGLRSSLIIFTAYLITGLLSGVSGLIYASRIGQNDSNNAGINYELDAILAVVIGGTSMSGGKFSLTGTVIGSIIIRTIITFVYYFGVAAEATMVFRALIVVVVIVLQSEPVREFMGKRRTMRKVAMGGELHG
ncbi:MAG: ABC transporter permease [Clostridiales bacterium]|nr:ABC transporter permease [Clostridiales bacterium]